MRLASGKMALRVRMDLDLLAQGFDFLPRRRNALPHASRRSAAGNIVDRQYRSRFQAFVKILIECRIQSAQLIEREILQAHIAFPGTSSPLCRSVRARAAKERRD